MKALLFFTTLLFFNSQIVRSQINLYCDDDQDPVSHTVEDGFWDFETQDCETIKMYSEGDDLEISGNLEIKANQSLLIKGSENYIISIKPIIETSDENDTNGKKKVVIGKGGKPGGDGDKRTRLGVLDQEEKWILESNKEQTQELTVSIYPNPVAKVLNISTQLAISKYTVHSINSVICLQGDMIGNTIPVASLSKGLYFMQFKTNSGIIIKKFIKN